MFCYKIHKTQFGKLIAICDKSLNGKTLDNKGIKFFVNPRFYCDKTIGNEILDVISDSNDGNIVGNEIVDLLLGAGLISEETVMLVEGIKHAQFTIL